MQLKKDARSSLALATLGLLGSAPAAAADGAKTWEIDPAVTPVVQLGPASTVAAAGARTWDIDSAVLVYSESEGRVQAIEPVVQVTRSLTDDRVLSFKVVVDALTGASPNGAAPASTVQSFTSPSGNSTAPAYRAAPGEFPLDDEFRDTRVALSADYLFPVSADGKLGFGVNASKEFDFTSAAANARYTHDLNQSNTTLSAGVSFEYDQSDPVGGAPLPLSLLSFSEGEVDDDAEDDDDAWQGGVRPPDIALDKSVIDMVLGLAQVISPTSVVQFNYALSLSSGYHTDPYKILSVVGSDGEPLRYVHESRPDARTKHALFGRYKKSMFGRDVVDASYRFMTDDWGVQSHTLDLSYRWNYAERDYLEPHLRLYTQTEADFYHAALYDGDEARLDYASADPRLGAFDAATFGIKYGHTFKGGNQWSARLEYYQQQGREAGVPDAAAAGLSKFDLAPDMSAVMFTLGYRFKW